MKPRAALPNRLITLFLLLAIVFSTSHAAWAQDSATSVEAANTAATADAAATLPATSADAVQPSAFKRFESTIDGAAGKLVGYLAAVIFYDVVFWDNPTADSPPDAPNVVVPLAVLWLILGAVYFTLKMQFINFRGFFHAIEVTMGKFDKPGAEGEVSHFQALTAALSATVGLGNIAGVAIAVSTGGPGATFWMIVAGLLGMTSKFAECTLGQRYRQIRPDGRVMGGAMYYLSNGLTEIGLRPLGTVLALLFTVLCIGGSFGGGCAFQVNQSLGAVRQTFPALAGHEWVYGLIMTGLVGIVIIGGIRRIAAIAEKIVPLMCGVYVAACLFILLKNAALLPNAISEIV
ncbi:MAG: sodium:alanine symporter family protein, partial [Planctomycetales bacterium]|nr:sodium:alanine symporter family protein [Planctomycetales bacterium]